MPPEPLPWDRKESFFKERKHERSESLGSVARWRDSSHHGSREFNRWGSADFRRPPGHGKQGGWHLFSEESGHGYALSRSGDKMLEEENCRPSISVSRGDGKYSRNSRESRGSFSQRDWRGHSWETTNVSLNLSRRPPDMITDHRVLDDMLTYPSHPHSDFVNTWDEHHLKEQHDKMGGVNGMGTNQRCDRENSVGSLDWKPLKWTRSGSLSSRGSGFSHSSSCRSMGGTDSYEAKADLLPKNATAMESHSGDAAACTTSAAPSEETTSRKKPRLGWGQGLAQYEKKKVEGPDRSANKDGPVLSSSNLEACNFLGPGLVDKSPKITGFSDCASPATPSSVACSSSPGVDDKLFGKAPNVDNDISNLCSSPGPGFQNLEKLDVNSLGNLASSIYELLQYDDRSSMNKLLIWKADVSKVLEVTETEIDSLENELKSLNSGSGGSCPCPSALGSLREGNSAKSCEEHAGGSDKIYWPEPLHVVSSADPGVDKMPLSNNLCSSHANLMEEDIDSPGTATSKFIEPLPLVNIVSSGDMVQHDNCSGDLDRIHSTSMKCLMACTNKVEASLSAFGDGCMSKGIKDGVGATSGAAENVLCNTIIHSNKESANRACQVFDKLLPKDCCMTGNMGAVSDLNNISGTLIKRRLAERKQFANFKERVIAIKFRALHHLWKEDMRLLSVRKCRPKSHKKLEVSLRTTNNGYQKHRSSIRSRFAYPAGNLSLVPTSEIINFTGKLLSDSQIKVHRNNLKMPALILDEREKVTSRFVSSNGLVEDPLALEKERAMINPWTSEEKEIFMEKSAAFGKDFKKIASFLDHKTTADCVEFYYKNHKSDCFEKIRKKHGVSKLGKLFSANTDLVTTGKKWNCEINAASLEILSAASLMACHADRITSNQKICSSSSLFGGYGIMKTSRGEDGVLERSSSFDILGDERETVAADVLAGICNSLSSEAMSSCITSSIDPADGNKDRKYLKVNPVSKQPLTSAVTQNVDDETSSDESCGEMDPVDWTDEEKSAFLQAVSSFGKDFAMISQCVGTRSQDQCKVFFSKARKCLGLDLMRPRPGNDISQENDNAKSSGSDTDDAGVVETGSVVGTDKSSTKTDEDMPLPAKETCHKESNPVEARNSSTDLNNAKNTNGTEVDHKDAANVDNMVSDASKLLCGGDADILCSSGNSGSDNAHRALIMSANKEVEKDDFNKLGDVVLESASAARIIAPSQSSSVADSKLVSEVSSRDLRNELEGQKLSLPRCLDGDDKHRANACSVVELRRSMQDSSSTINASLPSGGHSCSGSSLDTETWHLGSHERPLISSLPLENPHSTASSLLQSPAAVQGEKMASQDRLSSTHDLQDRGDGCCHNSICNDDHNHITGHHLLDRSSILQGYPLQTPVKKEANGDLNCSSSTTELPLLSQKIEQTNDHYRMQSRHPFDLEKTSRNGDVKLFGKILTNSSSAQKPNLSTKGNEENGNHFPKLSSKSSTLKFNGHHNVDVGSTILKFDRNDYLGLENVPMRSYGYWDGNRIQTGLASLPDSNLLLAKYPAAFSNYPTNSAKLDPQSLQALSKNNEQHLSGVSAFTTRDVNSSNGAVDYQVYRSRDSPKVPFMVDVKHRQDVYSEMQRRNGFQALSSLQQQGRGIVGMNGVGRPGVIVGGSRGSVSDPVAAIKMHYSNSDQFGQTGSILREDESWGGKGDLGR
ncbi:hypothetical protein L6164_007258 [Bauhinia variegata]|uniref:Uncharacterized protein n=1 Tax=Bauhinia variegata TaxID=167791 RepID=A0ACB9PDB8_BAUVA|nr:hypothetical protein L6164_007258 [Bauhinia variegata]